MSLERGVAAHYGVVVFAHPCRLSMDLDDDCAETAWCGTVGDVAVSIIATVNQITAAKD